MPTFEINENDLDKVKRLRDDIIAKIELLRTELKQIAASSGLEQVLNVTNSKVGDMSVGQLIKLTEAIENIAG